MWGSVLFCVYLPKMLQYECLIKKEKWDILIYVILMLIYVNIEEKN